VNRLTTSQSPCRLWTPRYNKKFIFQIILPMVATLPCCCDRITADMRFLRPEEEALEKSRSNSLATQSTIQLLHLQLAHTKKRQGFAPFLITALVRSPDRVHWLYTTAAEAVCGALSVHPSREKLSEAARCVAGRCGSECGFNLVARGRGCWLRI
jgi:hypothetical protein